MIKIILKIIIFLSFTNFCYAQIDSIQLLKPTGTYPIGTTTHEWLDETREMKISASLIEKRNIITQIWYPATIDSNAIPAPYSALSTDYRNTYTNSYLRASFANEIKKQCPLIIIVPGRGMERFVYTTIAEDLASHGFVVAAVDLPEIGYVLYQDGLVLKPSNEFKTPNGMMAGPYEKVDEFFEKPTEIGYQDVLFAIKKINELNKIDANNKLKNKINTNNIGIFSHSLGGRIAGELTARYKKIDALVAMEGIAPRDVRYEGKINVPSLMLCSAGTLKYAAENYDIFIENRKNIVYMTELIGFGHNSLTDNPYIYPKSYKYDIDAAKGLEIGRKLVTDFFYEYLKGKKGFYKKNKNNKLVKIVRHKK